MSDTGDQRAAQKARTRKRIKVTAQGLFAEHGFEAVTVVQVAAEAQVSVQTVFNHFTGKEELFFAERADWVSGPARAVRSRARGEAPKTALRRHFLGAVEDYARAAATPEHRALIRVLADSPALLTHERSLHEEAVAHLGDALAEAWNCTDGACRVLAEVTASIWLAAMRTILIDLRTTPRGPDDDAVRAAVELTDRVLGDLDTGLSISQAGAADPACRAA